MADSGDSFRKQHDIEEIEENADIEVNNGDPVTPLAEDDDQTEVSTNNVDELYESAYGNDPDGKTIKKAIDEDEQAIAHDLDKEQE